MKNLEFKKIDAFAAGASRGNPAGYVRLERLDALTADEMLAVARELEGFVSEVGFASIDAGGIVHLRYFSAAREVDFCGHATVAILHDLLRTDPDLSAREVVTIQTPKGRLTVENRIEQEDAVFVESPAPTLEKRESTPRELASLLSIEIGMVAPNLPVFLVNAGLATLVIGLRGPDEVLAAKPELDPLAEYCRSHGADIVTLFGQGGTSVSADYRTRVFAPTFGYLEDPATGSGNSALGYYLRQLGLWQSGGLEIEQNDEPDGFNVVRLRWGKNAAGEDRVIFGGPAITRLSGIYHLRD